MLPPKHIDELVVLIKDLTMAKAGVEMQQVHYLAIV